MTVQNNDLKKEEVALRNQSVDYENKINSAVNFLTDPTVKNLASSTDRDNFLRRKGLSENEIRTAYDRAGLCVVPPAVQVASPTISSCAQNTQIQRLSFFGKLEQCLKAVAILGIGTYAVYSIFKKLVMPYLYPQSKPKSIEDVAEELHRSISTSVDAVRSDVVKTAADLEELTNELRDISDQMHYVNIDLIDDDDEDALASLTCTLPSWQQME